MADLSEMAGLLQDLVDFHGRSVPPAALLHYGETLSRSPTSLVRDGIRRWKQANSPSSKFPSLAQLQGHIDDARTEIWRKGKKGENRNPISAPKLALEPAYQAACWDLVNRARSMTAQELADAFDEMHRAWPHRRNVEFDGWDHAAERLRAEIAAGRFVTRSRSGSRSANPHAPTSEHARVPHTPMTRAQEEARRLELLDQAASLFAKPLVDSVTRPDQPSEAAK